jgi:hypothetical protein
MQEMIDHDPNRCGKIQAANSAPYGDFIARIRIPYVRGKAMGLLPEKEVISKAHFRLWVILRGMFAKSDQICLSELFSPLQENFKAFMVPYIHLMPVVQASPFEMFVVHPKAKRVYQVQPYLRSTAQSGDVSCIGWDFRLIQNNVQRGIFNDPMLYFCDIFSH